MKLSTDQKRNLKALLDCALPECKPVQQFFQNLKINGWEVAQIQFEARGIKNQIYWEHAKNYIQELI